MTLYGATDPQVIGQPISPFFGAQNGIKYAGAPVIPTPAQVNGPQVPVLDSAARGSIPVNAVVSTVSGVSVGSGGIGGDNTSVLQLLGCGNSADASTVGAATAGAAGNPTAIMQTGINNQIFVDGIATTNAALSTGPAATDVSELTQAPVSGATTVNNVALVAQGFQG